MTEPEFSRRFKVGDLVEFLPEFRDPGDEDFEWTVVSDEEKGRVDVRPATPGLTIAPTYTVEVSWLRPMVEHGKG